MSVAFDTVKLRPNSREELFQVCERLHVAHGIVRVGLRSHKLVVPALDEFRVGLGPALADDGQDDVFVPSDCVAARFGSSVMSFLQVNLLRCAPASCLVCWRCT